MGKINLYEFKYEEVSGKEVLIKSDYFMERTGEKKALRIKSGKFKKQIAEVMPDYRELVKEIQDGYYKYEDLSNVVNRYNKWYTMNH